MYQRSVVRLEAYSRTSLARLLRSRSRAPLSVEEACIRGGAAQGLTLSPALYQNASLRSIACLGRVSCAHLITVFEQIAEKPDRVHVTPFPSGVPLRLIAWLLRKVAAALTARPPPRDALPLISFLPPFIHRNALAFPRALPALIDVLGAVSIYIQTVTVEAADGSAMRLSPHDDEAVTVDEPFFPRSVESEEVQHRNVISPQSPDQALSLSRTTPRRLLTSLASAHAQLLHAAASLEWRGAQPMDLVRLVLRLGAAGVGSSGVPSDLFVAACQAVVGSGAGGGSGDRGGAGDVGGVVPPVVLKDATWGTCVRLLAAVPRVVSVRSLPGREGGDTLRGNCVWDVERAFRFGGVDAQGPIAPKGPQTVSLSALVEAVGVSCPQPFTVQGGHGSSGDTRSTSTEEGGEGGGDFVVSALTTPPTAVGLSRALATVVALTLAHQSKGAHVRGVNVSRGAVALSLSIVDSVLFRSSEVGSVDILGRCLISLTNAFTPSVVEGLVDDHFGGFRWGVLGSVGSSVAGLSDMDHAVVGAVEKAAVSLFDRCGDTERRGFMLSVDEDVAQGCGVLKVACRESILSETDGVAGETREGGQARVGSFAKGGGGVVVGSMVDGEPKAPEGPTDGDAFSSSAMAVVRCWATVVAAVCFRLSLLCGGTDRSLDGSEVRERAQEEPRGPLYSSVLGIGSVSRALRALSTPVVQGVVRAAVQSAPSRVDLPMSESTTCRRTGLRVASMVGGVGDLLVERVASFAKLCGRTAVDDAEDGGAGGAHVLPPGVRVMDVVGAFRAVSYMYVVFQPSAGGGQLGGAAPCLPGRESRAGSLVEAADALADIYSAMFGSTEADASSDSFVPQDAAGSGDGRRPFEGLLQSAHVASLVLGAAARCARVQTSVSESVRRCARLASDVLCEWFASRTSAGAVAGTNDPEEAAVVLSVVHALGLVAAAARGDGGNHCVALLGLGAGGPSPLVPPDVLRTLATLTAERFALFAALSPPYVLVDAMRCASIAPLPWASALRPFAEGAHVGRDLDGGGREKLVRGADGGGRGAWCAEGKAPEEVVAVALLSLATRAVPCGPLARSLCRKSSSTLCTTGTCVMARAASRVSRSQAVAVAELFSEAGQWAAAAPVTLLAAAVDLATLTRRVVQPEHAYGGTSTASGGVSIQVLCVDGVHAAMPVDALRSVASSSRVATAILKGLLRVLSAVVPQSLSCASHLIHAMRIARLELHRLEGGLVGRGPQSHTPLEAVGSSIECTHASGADVYAESVHLHTVARFVSSLCVTASPLEVATFVGVVGRSFSQAQVVLHALLPTIARFAGSFSPVEAVEIVRAFALRFDFSGVSAAGAAQERHYSAGAHRASDAVVALLHRVFNPEGDHQRSPLTKSGSVGSGVEGVGLPALHPSVAVAAVYYGFACVDVRVPTSCVTAMLHCCHSAHGGVSWYDAVGGSDGKCEGVGEGYEGGGLEVRTEAAVLGPLAAPALELTPRGVRVAAAFGGDRQRGLSAEGQDRCVLDARVALAAVQVAVWRDVDGESSIPLPRSDLSGALLPATLPPDTRLVELAVGVTASLPTVLPLHLVPAVATLSRALGSMGGSGSDHVGAAVAAVGSLVWRTLSSVGTARRLQLGAAAGVASLQAHGRRDSETSVPSTNQRSGDDGVAHALQEHVPWLRPLQSVGIVAMCLCASTKRARLDGENSATSSAPEGGGADVLRVVVDFATVAAASSHLLNSDRKATGLMACASLQVLLYAAEGLCSSRHRRGGVGAVGSEEGVLFEAAVELCDVLYTTAVGLETSAKPTVAALLILVRTAQLLCRRVSQLVGEEGVGKDGRVARSSVSGPDGRKGGGAEPSSEKGLELRKESDPVSGRSGSIAATLRVRGRSKLDPRLFEPKVGPAVAALVSICVSFSRAPTGVVDLVAAVAAVAAVGARGDPLAAAQSAVDVCVRPQAAALPEGSDGGVDPLHLLRQHTGALVRDDVVQLLQAACSASVAHATRTDVHAMVWMCVDAVVQISGLVKGLVRPA